MKPTEFIVETSQIAQEADNMHADHEVQMARADCYNAAKYAIELHKLLKNMSESQGLDGWVSEKITLANDYLRMVHEYLKYENVAQPDMMGFTAEAAEYAFDQLLVEDDYDDAVKDYFSKGGKVEKLPAKKPRQSEKTDFSSKHIGGKGEVGRGKSNRIGKAAKTDPKGKPVVTAEGEFEGWKDWSEKNPDKLNKQTADMYAQNTHRYGGDDGQPGAKGERKSTGPTVDRSGKSVTGLATGVSKPEGVPQVSKKPITSFGSSMRGGGGGGSAGVMQDPEGMKSRFIHFEGELGEMGETGEERAAAASRENERYDNARNYQGRNARGDVIRSGGEVVRGNPNPPSLIQRAAGALGLPNTAKDALGDPMYKSSRPEGVPQVSKKPITSFGGSMRGGGGGGGGSGGSVGDIGYTRSMDLGAEFDPKTLMKRSMKESATGGGSSAGGIATSMGGPGHKPTSGVPKKLGNAAKMKKVTVGKGIY